MSTVSDHYRSHLAPVYLWMAGGIEHALAAGAGDLAAFLDRSGQAVDLGAGFGMHSIPLARAGFDVLAVDISALLLGELVQHASGLPLTAVEADLLDFTAHLHKRADLILCMGDTLTHLSDVKDVERLMHDVFGSLRPGGQFVATFRDYRELPDAEHRFIPVRSDGDRILTCFLEAVSSTRVRVHDILHERTARGWSVKVSCYDKLRLAPEAVMAAAENAGLHSRLEPGPRGMLQLVATS